MKSQNLMRDERGLAGIVIAGIVALLAIFGLSAASTIEWRFLLAVMAMGIVGMAFVGVLFFKADFKMVLIAAVIAIGIVFIVEVSLPMIIGGVIIIAAMWHLKMLSKRPLMLLALVACGLLVMVLGANMVLIPMRVLP